MTNTLQGTWLLQEMSFFQDNAKVGTWPEVGTAMFDASGHFCLAVQYQGSDSSYPKEMLKFLASAGTYKIEGKFLVTMTRCSSSEKRINQTQEYEVAINGDVMCLKMIHVGSGFEGTWKRA